MADTVAPLCTSAQFSEGAFADLVSAYPATALDDVMLEATRRCEDLADRRLAPFTGLTETGRAGALDPEEYAGSTTNLPVDIQATLGMSYAASLGANNLVRHYWLKQYAPRYEDLWTYSNVTISVIRSYGGTEQLTPTQILNGPEPGTGHVWFQLGVFVPVGSRVQAIYGGGYQVAIPASLVRACKYMAASIVIRELNPDDVQHNPDQLEQQAEKWIARFARDGIARK